MLQVRIRTGCRVDNLVLGIVDARLEKSRFLIYSVRLSRGYVCSCRCRIQNLGFLSRKKAVVSHSTRRVVLFQLISCRLLEDHGSLTAPPLHL
jgi:hypothetical protein